MSKRMIITITREYGSGGRVIGKQVADNLGIKFYDNELIKLAAEESGLSEEFIRQTEQQITNSFLFNLSRGATFASSMYTETELPIQDKIHLLQNKIIQRIAEGEDCLILGRCGNYILKENFNCMNVFIHSDRQLRLKRIINEYGVDEQTAEKELKKIDKGRANHYQQYTDLKWGDAKNYTLTLDSSILGTEHCAEIIEYTAKKFFE